MMLKITWSPEKITYRILSYLNQNVASVGKGSQIFLGRLESVVRSHFYRSMVILRAFQQPGFDIWCWSAYHLEIETMIVVLIVLIFDVERVFCSNSSLLDIT